MERILVYGMTNNKGGIESYLMNIFRTMDKSRIMFDFVTDFPSMVYDEEVLSSGAKIYYIPAKGKHPIKQFVEFYRLLKGHPEYQVVYFNILSAGSFYNMLAALWTKRRIVAHSHNGSTGNLFLHKVFQPLLNRFVDSKLACSELAARFMFGEKAYKNSEIRIIKNAIDAGRFRYSTERRAMVRQTLKLDDCFVVCHVGRMDEQKNPRFLIDIFEALKKNENRTVLVYIGTGPMEDEIREYARHKGTNDDIRFLGLRSDIDKLLQGADVFLLPSLFEGLPIALIEAQAAGLKCFTSSEKISREVDITGLVEFISLTESASFWAARILESKGYERRNVSEKIVQHGYDIQTEVRKLENYLYALQE